MSEYEMTYRLKRGEMVFWSADNDGRPRWVIEWQKNNGDGCYWLVDASGEGCTATKGELSYYPYLKKRKDEDE